MKRTGLSLCGMIALGCALVIGASCGTKEEKGKSADTAAAPAISSVEILPENPSKSSLLETVVKFAQPATAEVRYRWMKNGKEIMGRRKVPLDRTTFKKGIPLLLR